MPQVKTIEEDRTKRSIERHEYRTKKPPGMEPARGSLKNRAITFLLLSVLLTIVAAPAVSTRFSVVDDDIWWHLKIGDWIIGHFGVPHRGMLSRTAADQPWMAYSWIYEVLLSFFSFSLSPDRYHWLRLITYSDRLKIL